MGASCGWYYNGQVWGPLPCGGGQAVAPPSPTPPWNRPLQCANAETLNQSGPISLTVDPSFLVRQAVTPSVPQSMTIPNGNFVGQVKTVIIPGAMLIGPLGPSEVWNIAGAFSGYSSLTMNNTAFNAILQWDGTYWQLMAGNAVTNP